MIAAIYARKSTEDTRSKEEGKSTERQIENATAYATEHDWIVEPDLIFVDEGISGGEFVNRPGLAACRAAAAAHRFQKLIVMERSRIGRDTIRTLACLEELEECDVEIHAYGDGRGVIRSGDLVTLVGAYSDADEKKKAANRTREGLTAKAKKGHATGPAPYGYRRVEFAEHSVYEIDPEQAAIVRQVFEWAAEGLGNARIRNKLTGTPHEVTWSPSKDEKRTKRTVTTWTRNSVRRMLANPIYLGRIEYGWTKNTPKGGKARRREDRPEPAVVVERPELRIVEQDLWDQIHERKAATRAHYSKGDPATKPAPGTVSKYLLTGILRCHECGSTMTSLGGTPRYNCLGKAHKGRAFCKVGSGPLMKALDDAVIRTLLDEVFSDPERLRQIIREKDQATKKPPAPNVDPVKEIAKLEREIQNLVNIAASGSQDVLAGITERRGKIERLKAIRPEASPATEKDILNAYTRWRITINRRHPQEVRALLHRLGCQRITVRQTAPNVWSYEGEFDAARLLNIDTPASPPGV